MHAYLSGFSVGLSLILAIGVQNAFVLKQGLKKQHVFIICLICAVSDALLIAFGVSGFHLLIKDMPWIAPIMRLCGAIFLLWYGMRSMISAWKSTETLVVQTAPSISLFQAALTCLMLTWLNPHVYLDTVVLIGTVSTQFIPQHYIFGMGAASASFVFFFSLGYGAVILRPIFTTAKAWRIFEAAIALMMWGIAIKLLLGF